MKCPKCGYHSFDHLDSCRKCNSDLSEHKTKFNLRGFFFPGQAATAPMGAATKEDAAIIEQPVDDPAGFGFAFLEEEESPASRAAKELSLDADGVDINISQPFNVDSETVPADDNGDKPAKDPDFSF
jgi:hypothetical protein